MVLEKLQNIAYSSKDFSLEEIDAILYGIFLGWDEDCFYELKMKFGWSETDIQEIEVMNQIFELLVKRKVAQE